MLCLRALPRAVVVAWAAGAAAVAQTSPISNISPGSNLLAPGSTSVALAFTTSQPATCRYSVGAAQAFSAMQAFDTGQPATAHQGTIQGLSPSPAVVNSVYLRCDSDPNNLTTLQYRAVASPTGSFPRVGSIWWGSYIASSQPSQAAKIQLYLCPAFNLPQARAIRAANPNVLMLPNVNATEATSFNTPPNVPEAYFLHDTNGNKIPNWPIPGDYILNLTKPEVADFMANYAYQVLLQSGLVYDGIFFDNFHTTISWLKTDYAGHPVQLDADGDGQPDDPATLDAAWSAGVYHLIASFRRLVPYGLVTGHLDSRPPQAPALAVFNGESLNGDAPRVREGFEPFATFWQALGDWFQQGQAPGITLVQSSPPLQVAYGYGFTGGKTAPPGVQAFAQRFYPNMRFGLAAALMTDGFSTYDFGDTSSPENWWYDEYDFNLGYPLGPATSIAGAPGAGPNLMANGGFESGTLAPWQTNSGSGGKAVTVLDASIAAEGNASAQVTVSATSQNAWQITLEQDNLAITQGVTYQFQFWARADTPRNVSVICQGGAPSYTNYGLFGTFSVGPSWRLFTTSFTAAATATDARVEFWVGDATGNVWFDGVQLSAALSPDLYRRDFSNGVVLLNATPSAQTIAPGAGLQRFTGTQAPKYQYIVDDSGAGFVPSGAWSAVTISNGGTGTGPGSQVAAGPYYHAWHSSAHQLTASAGSATWDLRIPEDGRYTIQVWLPASPQASSWTANAVYELVSGGNVIASANLDQSTASAGDGWHLIATADLAAAGSPVLRIHNGGSGILIADAVYVTSAALYNDGSPATQVTLAPMDGILLQRQRPVPAPSSRVNAVTNAASFGPAIASGGFVSVMGTGFGNVTRTWRASDFSGSSLPVSLDGISVTINGKPAYLAYISPTQINAIAPDDETMGPVSVEVTTPVGASYAGTVIKQKLSPALFTYSSRATVYAAAVHLDGTLVGPPGTSSRPAVPGEVVSLYGTAFGPANPPTPASQLVAQAAPLVAAPSVTVVIGGANAEVLWAGLVAPGLDQVNVRIPNLAAGDQSIAISASGFEGASGVFVPIAGN